ncbi:arginine/serine-rich coiled-coil protein 2 isoform X3 [Neoarius graeffei]|uniref:arginine/serine-rich coiled-coil protein 2 isoform X3 n=1 Tax=Neoarius graeffei TaxID=443677 RepID=UPI00298CCA68|nr:arginine/serine-rich coiled-coil protein 2 isoform X3 [Neoarius graeffei]XP_060762805.1 arginine/serine-rich coiled-coil protein 2 isoform X3 [Neoarius graeffei]
MPTSGQARRRDPDKLVRSHSRSEDLLQSSDKERERLSEDSGEERHRRKDKRSSRGRTPSRSRSRESHRRHRSRSRDRRRSRSRSRERRSKSRERKRRPKSRSRSRSKHRQRSRSRSKSREKKKKSEKVRRKSHSRSPSPVVFRGRNTAMDAQEALARRLERAKKLQEQKEKELLEKHQQQQQEIVAAAAAATAPLLCDHAPAAASSPALNVAALLASGTQVTPQIAMAAQMAALQAKTLAETGIAVPSYYNPSAVNPMKFAEQEKKRKLLWQGKKEGDKSQTAELWEKLNFGNKDQNVKFRKLMGIKADDDSSSGDLNEEGMKTLQQQEEMFRNLDVQYEMARSQTHTQRGMGLGFSTSFSSRGTDPV